MNIRRNKNILSLRMHAMENTHISHQAAISPLKNDRLKSTMPLSICMHRLSHDIDNISPEDWAQHDWRGRWKNSNYQLNNFIAYPTSKPPGYSLKQSQWVGYFSIASGLVTVDMQASCVALVCVRMQILYVVQFKLLNTYWIAVC